MLRGFAHRRADLVILLLLSTATLVVAAIFSERFHGLFWDDTYISLQYTKNLARGHGLVFNVGERVEGYTNFLWVVALAPLHRLADVSGADFSAMVRSGCAAATLANIWLTYAIARRLFGHDRIATLVPPTLLAADMGTPFFAMMGLENPFQQLWLLLAFYAWLSRKRSSPVLVGAALSLAALTRLDSLIFAAVLLIVEIRELGRQSGGAVARQRWRALAVTFGILAATLGAHVAWRYYYYGYPLPNTYYVKVTGGLKNLQWGKNYLWQYARERALLPIAALAGLAGLRIPWLALCLGFAMLHGLYVLRLGGDFYAGSRFLVVLSPFLYLVVGRIVAYWHERLCRWLSQKRYEAIRDYGAAAMVAFLALLFIPTGVRLGAPTHVIRTQAALHRDMVHYAEFIRSVRTPGDSIFAGRIGAIAYFGDIRVIDVYGLVDLAIAHEMVPIGGLDMPGHQKEATPEYGLWHAPTFIPHNLYSRDYRADGYYLLARRPEGALQPMIWKREDLAHARPVPGTHIDFEQLDDRWVRRGRAFAHNPVRRALGNQQHVLGRVGGHINSFHEIHGDSLTGELVSPPFTVEGNRLLLDVGGGSERAGVRVELVVTGDVVASTTGNNSEYLCRVVWDVSAFRGAEARLRIVDEGSSPFAHILVDSVRQLELP